MNDKRIILVQNQKLVARRVGVVGAVEPSALLV